MTEGRSNSKGLFSIAGLIAAETVVCFFLIYVSALRDWPFHIYFRFTVLLPLYQAGAAYGLFGGTALGLACALLFAPIIPLDSEVVGDPTGFASMAAMIAFIVFFGLFVGIVVGKSRMTRKHAEAMAEITMKLAGASDEATIIRLSLSEAAQLTGALEAVALLEDGDGGRTIFTAGADGVEELRGVELAEGHALLAAMRMNASFVSFGVSSDPRFPGDWIGDDAGSLAVYPVGHKGKVYGALMAAGNFSGRDCETLEMVARMAGAAARNIRQELATESEALRERSMKDLFSRFVSANVADHLLSGGDGVAAGIQRELTALVSDIRDFTRISEGLTPQQVVSQLNEYYSVVVDAVLKHGGSVDKYIGDCLIAYWGAPEPDEDHAARAAGAALSMSAAIDVLNDDWRRRGMPAFNTGIGLHTGEMLVCNIGNEHKMNFTLVGEELARAMEVEALTKNYGRGIVMSARAAERAGPGFVAEELPGLDGAAGGEYFALVSKAVPAQGGPVA